MELTWLGHAAFRLDQDGETMLIDPFLSDNPACPIEPDEIDSLDYVLVSHGHDDHLGDAVELAARHDAVFFSNFEIVTHAQENGVEHAQPMNIGGTVSAGSVSVNMTEAQHSSGPGFGHQAGFVIDWDGHSIYHAGDTGLFSDMELIGDMLDPDLALLPIGDRFTMGPPSAARAVEFLDVEQVIPMHYNTFDFVAQDPQDFVDLVGDSADVVVLQPGETHTLL